jgi:hypothetical protein
MRGAIVFQEHESAGRVSILRARSSNIAQPLAPRQVPVRAAGTSGYSALELGGRRLTAQP